MSEDFQGIHLRVLYDFEYISKDERKIKIQEGERLFLIKKTNSDWWQVIRSSSERPFFVPAAYVEEYTCDQDASENSHSSKHSKRKVSDENVERIREAFQRSPRKSIRQASVQLNIPPTTVHTVLHKRLRLRAYKLQLHQMITPNDKLERKRFAETMLDKVDDDDTFLTRVCFSDEATFHTVTADTYLDMLQLYAVPQLPDGAIFQQDGAPPHFANMVRTFLDEQFPARWIGRGSPYITWPARSPDLTPPDFSCGDLQERIYAAVNNVTPQMLHNTWVEVEYRLDISVPPMEAMLRFMEHKGLPHCTKNNLKEDKETDALNNSSEHPLHREHATSKTQTERRSDQEILMDKRKSWVVDELVTQLAKIKSESNIVASQDDCARAEERHEKKVEERYVTSSTKINLVNAPEDGVTCSSKHSVTVDKDKEDSCVDKVSGRKNTSEDNVHSIVSTRPLEGLKNEFTITESVDEDPLGVQLEDMKTAGLPSKPLGDTPETSSIKAEDDKKLDSVVSGANSKLNYSRSFKTKKELQVLKLRHGNSVLSTSWENELSNPEHKKSRHTVQYKSAFRNSGNFFNSVGAQVELKHNLLKASHSGSELDALELRDVSTEKSIQTQLLLPHKPKNAALPSGSESEENLDESVGPDEGSVSGLSDDLFFQSGTSKESCSDISDSAISDDLFIASLGDERKKGFWNVQKRRQLTSKKNKVESERMARYSLPPSPSPDHQPVKILKEDWQEYQTSAGRTYYYNLKSHEKSWKPPRRQQKLLIPDLPRKSSVAAFRLATGHYCLAKHLHRIEIYQLAKHLHRIEIYQSPNCLLCNSNQEMDSEHLKICASVADHDNIFEKYWSAREYLTFKYLSIRKNKLQLLNECRHGNNSSLQESIDSLGSNTCPQEAVEQKGVEYVPVPEGWHEAYDEVSGQLCYINDASGAKVRGKMAVEMVLGWKERSTVNPMNATKFASHAGVVERN
ncbi:hypothetical protein ANN_15054 [Periplaneta americana]|uniref:Uncharacterized protein n=1 Tax=Periplaneta americana TaxID=6978 RepID=A0ABQ8SZM1_PERAM|nr:hypothetical protein ANN_15054 [Periplaneta americana]